VQLDSEAVGSAVAMVTSGGEGGESEGQAAGEGGPSATATATAPGLVTAVPWAAERSEQVRARPVLLPQNVPFPHCRANNTTEILLTSAQILTLRFCHRLKVILLSYL
jgi:hypothetical protein